MIRKRIIKYLLRPFSRGNVTYSYDTIGINSLLAKGDFEVPVGCLFSGKVSVGKYSTIGTNCFFRGTITIGNYCQFGSGVSFHSRNHPLDRLSTYQNKRLFQGELKKLRTDREIVVENDVWIGHGATILSGVNIGNGAVIAAGAVVIKNVDPYSIVAGVPAKHIKYRMSKDEILKVQQLKWWDKSPKELESIKDEFFKSRK